MALEAFRLSLESLNFLPVEIDELLLCGDGGAEGAASRVEDRAFEAHRRRDDRIRLAGGHVLRKLDGLGVLEFGLQTEAANESAP